MSSEELRKVSLQEIQQVQNLIEHYIQDYMNRREVVDALSVQAKVEPEFTELVWEKLEEENQEFFKAYHLYLMAKQQIMIFNALLQIQVEQMCSSPPQEVASRSILNGPRSSFHMYPPSQHPFHAYHEVPNSNYCNLGLSGLGNMQYADDNLIRMMHALPNMQSTQNSEMLQQMNELRLKAEPIYSDRGLMLDTNGNVLGMPQAAGYADVPFYENAETTLQAFNGTLMATDTALMKFEQFPDLTTHHFRNSVSDGYSRSPFLGTDVKDSYVGVNPRLDAISEGLCRSMQ